MAHLLLPGNAGDYASAPEQNLSDIDVRAWIQPDSWSTLQCVVGQYSGASATRSWMASIGQSNLKRLSLWNSSGTVDNFDGMNTSHSFADGVGRWVRYTLDADDGGGNRVLRFETSTESEDLEPTAVTWTLVQERTLAGAITLNTSPTQDWHIGGDPISNSYWFAGSIKRVWVSDTIGGSPVFDPDPSDPTTWTYS